MISLCFASSRSRRLILSSIVVPRLSSWRRRARRERDVRAKHARRKKCQQRETGGNGDNPRSGVRWSGAGIERGDGGSAHRAGDVVDRRRRRLVFLRPEQALHRGSRSEVRSLRTLFEDAGRRHPETTKMKTRATRRECRSAALGRAREEGFAASANEAMPERRSETRRRREPERGRLRARANGTPRGKFSPGGGKTIFEGTMLNSIPDARDGRRDG